MKSLDFATMENMQGGGNITINLPISSLISALGLGSLLTVGLGAGVGISYNVSDLSGLTGGATGLLTGLLSGLGL